MLDGRPTSRQADRQADCDFAVSRNNREKEKEKGEKNHGSRKINVYGSNTSRTARAGGATVHSRVLTHVCAKLLSRLVEQRSKKIFWEYRSTPDILRHHCCYVRVRSESCRTVAEITLKTLMFLSLSLSPCLSLPLFSFLSFSRSRVSRFYFLTSLKEALEKSTSHRDS